MYIVVAGKHRHYTRHTCPSTAYLGLSRGWRLAMAPAGVLERALVVIARGVRQGVVTAREAL